MGKGSTASMCAAPPASIRVRSKPSATPQQSGQTGLERREQPLVESWQPGRPAPAALRDIPLEAGALLARAGELVEAVGELDALAVELEALRGARVVRIEPRQRRLAGGIAVHEGQSAVAEARADDGAHQQLEQLVAVGRRIRESRQSPRVPPPAPRAAP